MRGFVIPKPRPSSKEGLVVSKNRKDLIRQRLATSRQDLLSLLETLSQEQWQTAVFSEEEDGWQVADVLRHLVAAERGMLNLIERIRVGEEGVPADFDLHRYNNAMVRKSKEKSPPVLLADMSDVRERLLGLLESIEEDDWQKKGRHGSMHIMTIEEIFKTIALHDKMHGRDIRHALALE
jgi:uncharacterized protein (TIGR03083 family)